MSRTFFTLALAGLACATPFQAVEANSNDPCLPCQPQGAKGGNPPSVGSGLSGLYSDVLSSVKDIKFSKRSVEERASGFCCLQSLNCVNVQNLNIAMCYDKFTTNFKFEDGSYGSLTTGDYVSGNAKANLLNGNYTNGADQGNIYANNQDAKPNTATLSIPPQFTGTGVGAAVPASELGSVIVYTTTIPGTTFTAPTTVAGTVRVATVSGQTVSSTVDPMTISGATTIAPKTETVTQAVSAPTSKAAAAHNAAGIPVMGALMYGLLAL